MRRFSGVISTNHSASDCFDLIFAFHWALDSSMRRRV